MISPIKALRQPRWGPSCWQDWMGRLSTRQRRTHWSSAWHRLSWAPNVQPKDWLRKQRNSDLERGRLCQRLCSAQCQRLCSAQCQHGGHRVGHARIRADLVDRRCDPAISGDLAAWPGAWHQGKRKIKIQPTDRVIGPERPRGEHRSHALGHCLAGQEPCRLSFWPTLRWEGILSGRSKAYSAWKPPTAIHRGFRWDWISIFFDASNDGDLSLKNWDIIGIWFHEWNHQETELPSGYLT